MPVNLASELLFDICCSGDEGMRAQAPVKPQRNRKAMSCDAGTNISFHALCSLIIDLAGWNILAFGIVECVFFRV